MSLRASWHHSGARRIVSLHAVVFRQPPAVLSHLGGLCPSYACGARLNARAEAAAEEEDDDDSKDHRKHTPDGDSDDAADIVGTGKDMRVVPAIPQLAYNTETDKQLQEHSTPPDYYRTTEADAAGPGREVRTSPSPVHTTTSRSIPLRLIIIARREQTKGWSGEVAPHPSSCTPPLPPPDSSQISAVIPPRRMQPCQHARVEEHKSARLEVVESQHHWCTPPHPSSHRSRPDPISERSAPSLLDIDKAPTHARSLPRNHTASMEKSVEACAQR
ncbi:hypothetical protein K438DRAFT_2019769 [Mycena galopus ATCC 62051]|nr:hypothetical protein K438DRAFT_2019769 [Mycena galopus ATCC 62051]